ncbi:MAG: 16S rRNA (guanine(966)-N(2))-methyltransferase RsmD [Candidatus Nanopelagicales bacterium]
MTRIIGGAARGRRLRVPSAGTRPTSDRVREALFSALESLLGGWAGRRVLDLYAGSGALGLEAVSRGAAHALLVERDRRAAGVARGNVTDLGLDAATVLAASVPVLAASAPPAQAAPPYDVVLADPPYDLAADDLAAVLAGLMQHGWLADGAVIVLERSARDPEWRWPDGLEPLRDRRYGETRLWYGRRGGADAP